MDDVVIRPVTAEDAQAVGQLWVQLVQYHHELDERLPTASEQGAMLYARRIAERVDDTHMRAFVAEKDGEIIGFVLGMIVDLVPEMFQARTGGFLADIYVLDAHRGAGVGRGLADALADWFRSRGVSHMEWYVAHANRNGRAFWDKYGGDDVMIRMQQEL